MIALFYYLIKVVICSGVFFLYYHLALRNKVFHQWNRFYLLSAVVLSLALPLVQVQIQQFQAEESKTIQLLQVVQSADQYLEEITINGPQQFTTQDWIIGVYILISLILLILFIWAIFRIANLIRKHQVQFVQSIRFINTHLPESPFSFLRTIFWNHEIDLQSATGQQIFRHEMVHVREKHSYDKIFLQLVLIVFWCNPFFWLIRRELKVVHEFIADQKAVEDKDTSVLAAMILHAMNPAQFSALTNSFFQTSIKRRLSMLTKIQHPGISYVSRILALPILALVLFAFTIKTKKSSVPLEKEFVVVIDAGHGKIDGNFSGARSADLYEDQVVLALANKVVKQNSDVKLKLILSRTTDNSISLSQRVELARAAGAQLFLSLHTSAQPEGNTKTPATQNNSKGIEIFISGRGSSFLEQNRLFGSLLQQELKQVYPVQDQLKQAGNGIYVLDKNVCPSVLLECGFITDEKDRRFISSDKGQEQLADKILSAIHRYASAAADNSGKTGLIRDTVPSASGVGEAKMATVTDAAKKAKSTITFKEVTITFKDGHTETYSPGEEQLKKMNPEDVTSVYVTKSDSGYLIKSDKVSFTSNSGNSKPVSAASANPPLYIVDGKEYTGNINDLNVESIESVSIYKDKSAIEKWGEKAKNGVIVITLKSSGRKVKNVDL
jgi:N-acetylmuramoyl-L-alanine amidase